MKITWVVEAHSGIIEDNNERIQYIPNFPGYFVGDLGNVYSAHQKNFSVDFHKLKKKATFLTNKTKRKKPYYHVSLSYKGQPSVLSVHRLVAKAFVPNPHQYPVVHHTNGELDNRASKLMWVEQQVNCELGEKTKTHRLIDPNGAIIEVYNLARYCREHSIDKGSLYNYGTHSGYIYLGSYK